MGCTVLVYLSKRQVHSPIRENKSQFLKSIYMHLVESVAKNMKSSRLEE
jgi:hypothetical protein